MAGREPVVVDASALVDALVQPGSGVVERLRGYRLHADLVTW